MAAHTARGAGRLSTVGGGQGDTLPAQAAGPTLQPVDVDTPAQPSGPAALCVPRPRPTLYTLSSCSHPWIARPPAPGSHSPSAPW